MLRERDVIVAEGTFRIALNDHRRLIAIIDAKETMLGPMRFRFEIDRGISPEVLHHQELARRGLAPNTIVVAGIFDDIGHFVSKAAEGAFNTASHALTTITRPVFNVTRDAASHITHAIAEVTPFLPHAVRDQIHAAARIVGRAHLGDVKAKDFIHAIGKAAQAGVEGARHIGDALLEGTRIVARAVDLPVHLLGKVPVLGGILTSVSPLQKFDHMMGALQRGDFKALKEMVQGDIHMAQGIMSLVPGIGTGISSAISAAEAVLDGGSPIDIAIHAAYGAIPIPIGIRTITDTVLGTVLSFLHAGSVTDAMLAGARESVPSGLPRDIFDTLVHVIAKRVPIVKAGAELAGHYIEHYAGQAAGHILDGATKAIGGAHVLADAAKHLGDASHIAAPLLHAANVAGSVAPQHLGPVSQALANFHFLTPHAAGSVAPQHLGPVSQALANFHFLTPHAAHTAGQVDHYAAPFAHAAPRTPLGDAAVAQAMRAMHAAPQIAVSGEGPVAGEDEDAAATHARIFRPLYAAAAG